MIHPLQAVGMLNVKLWWHLKSPCPTATRLLPRHCCKLSPPEVHAPFLGRKNPRASNGEHQFSNQIPQPTPDYPTLQRHQQSSADGGSPCSPENIHHPTSPTTPTAPCKHQGSSCIAALSPGMAALASRREQLILAGLFHPPAPYCSPEPGPDPGYL